MNSQKMSCPSCKYLSKFSGDISQITITCPECKEKYFCVYLNNKIIKIRGERNNNDFDNGALLHRKCDHCKIWNMWNIKNVDCGVLVCNCHNAIDDYNRIHNKKYIYKVIGISPINNGRRKFGQVITDTGMILANISFCPVNGFMSLSHYDQEHLANLFSYCNPLKNATFVKPIKKPIGSTISRQIALSLDKSSISMFKNFNL